MKISIIIIALLFCCIHTNSFAKTLKSIQHPLDVPLYITDSITDTTQQKRLYTYLVESYTQQGLTDRAIQLIESLPKSLLILSKSLYETLFITYYSYNSAQDTILLLDKVSDKVRPYIIEACFQHSLDKKIIEDSLLFFNKINSPIIASRLCNLLVTYFVKHDDINKALIYHNLIQLPAEKEKSLASLVILYTKAGDIQKINTALTNISNETNRQTLLLNVVTTLVDINEYETALNFLDQLQQSPIYEKALTYVINYLIINDNFSAAIDYAQTLTTDFYKHQVMILLGQGFARSGNLLAINDLLTNIDSDTVMNQFITDVSLSLAKYSYIQEAFSLSHKLSPEIATKHYPALIESCDIKTDFHFLLLLIKQINNYQTINDTLLVYAVKLARDDQHEKANEIINTISDLTTKETCLLTILTTADDLTLYQDYYSQLSHSTIISYIHYLNTHSSKLLSEQDMLDFITIKPKKLNKANRLKYNIELGILYANHSSKFPANHKKAIQQAKSAKKLIKKLKEKVTFESLDRYIYLESLLDRTNQALATLKKQQQYHDNIKLLYTINHINDYDKKSLKLLRSFAKDFK